LAERSIARLSRSRSLGTHQFESDTIHPLNSQKNSKLLKEILYIVLCKMQFTYLKEKVEQKGCRLTWTEDEFSKLYKDSKSIINITSKCGHDTSVQCSNFLYCDTGVICKQCHYANFREHRMNVPTDYIIQEYNVIKAFQHYFNGKLDLCCMKESCLADFAVKPCDVNQDMWLPIQLKTAQSVSHGKYCYKINNNYPCMFIILFAIEEQRIWILDGCDINQKTINIGKANSIYSKYETTPNKLINQLINVYHNRSGYLKTLETLNIPIPETAQNALMFNKLREQIFQTLKFTYPEMSGTVHDAIVNNTYKVQDKVATGFYKKKSNNRKEYRDTQSFICNMIRKRTYTNLAYKLGDNDFYWIHLPDKKCAYIIPEHILYKYGVISDNEKGIGCALALYPYHTQDQMKKNKVKNDWLNDYLYFYERDHEKIVKLFEPNDRKPYYDDYVCPIVIVDKD
jgi:hypothetical protein